MKQLHALAVTAALLASTPSMALVPTADAARSRPAADVIGTILDRDTHHDTKAADKRARKEAKELRKREHEREKAIRKAERKRGKEARERANAERRSF